MKSFRASSEGSRLELFLYKDRVAKRNVIMLDVVEEGIRTTYTITNPDKLQAVMNWLDAASIKLRELY